MAALFSAAAEFWTFLLAGASFSICDFSAWEVLGDTLPTSRDVLVAFWDIKQLFSPNSLAGSEFSIYDSGCRSYTVIDAVRPLWKAGFVFTYALILEVRFLYYPG